MNPIRSAISGGADDVAEIPVVGTDVSTTDCMAGDGMAGDGEFATSRMLACADIAFDMALMLLSVADSSEPPLGCERCLSACVSIIRSIDRSICLPASSHSRQCRGLNTKLK